MLNEDAAMKSHICISRSAAMGPEVLLGIKNNTKQEIIPQFGHTRLGTDLHYFHFRRREGV